MWGIYKLVCTSWQNVIQFLLAMISDQLSNLSQFPIQLCIIPKWYNGKIMQKCEHENGGNLRSSTWKKIFPQKFFCEFYFYVCFQMYLKLPKKMRLWSMQPLFHQVWDVNLSCKKIIFLFNLIWLLFNFYF